ncbi:LysM peptidoglycan-binding domain-containing protein [Sporosarcina sp. FSL K6-2383]|uniref:LysM peptidoglycan-binding domain-containing protein n=1 Tax=Sporosarcina sp. FSL K6-2383 TaxID=2921556 RepID=UPI00315AAF7C
MRGIYFSANNDEEGFQLPILPEKVSELGAGDGEDFSISKLGNINIPKDPKLEEYPLESFFPATETHYSSTAFREPQYYIDALKRWKKNKMAVRYIYVNGSFSINELVTIEKFDYEESDGSGDVYFTLALKKYVHFAPKKMAVKKPIVSTASVKAAVVKKTAPPRQNSKPAPQTYSLISGDSLWKVAQKYLGDGNRFREIANLNGIKDSQFSSLPIGLKVKLPTK